MRVYASREMLRALLDTGELVVTPPSATERPASLVLHLGRRFRRWAATEVAIRPWSSNAYSAHTGPILNAATVTLQPAEFLLASTMESVGLSPRFGGSIAPLSHIARFGLQVHLGASWINPGFGYVTPTQLALELYNCNPSPLTLDAGMPICHLQITEIRGPIDRAPTPTMYEGKDPLGAPLLYEELGPRVSADAPSVRSQGWRGQC